MANKKLYSELEEHTTYIGKHTLNPQKTWIDGVHNHQRPELIIWFNKNNYKDFFYDKIIVDAGSGLGRMIPLLSFFKPKKIISVEPDLTLLEKQKKFLNSEFYFLPKKKINCEIEYINQNIEDFIDNKHNFDILCLFYVITYLDINKVFLNFNKNMLIMNSTRNLKDGKLLDIIKENNLNIHEYREFSTEEKWVTNGSHFLLSIKNNA
jgi:2-polyprenyl-3-methyl-5-hydroxy-6-metoxy-1,4-benzoquinol methylase